MHIKWLISKLKMLSDCLIQIIQAKINSILRQHILFPDALY